VLWSPTCAADRLRRPSIYLCGAAWARGSRQRRPLWTFFYNKWFFDELYDLVFVAPPAGSATCSGSDGDAGRSTSSADGVARGGLRRRAAGRDPDGFLYHYPLSCCWAWRASDLRLFAFGAVTDAEPDHLLAAESGGLLLLRMGRATSARAVAPAWIALRPPGHLALCGCMLARSIAAAASVPRARGALRGFDYAMGVDGISICSWSDGLPDADLHPGQRGHSRTAWARYMGRSLVLEKNVIGVITALDRLLFYVFFEAGLIPLSPDHLSLGRERTASMRPTSSSSTPPAGLDPDARRHAYMINGAGTTSSIPELAAFDFSARPALALPGLLRLLRGEDAHVAGAHLAARTPTWRRPPPAR
jgi:hypothetical protein